MGRRRGSRRLRSLPPVPSVAGGGWPGRHSKRAKMKFAIFGRIAGVLMLTVSLAACVDMTEEVNVTSDTTAKTTMTMTMGSDIYAMVKSSGGGSGDDKFCGKDGEKLTENADGTATCTMEEEGKFADLKLEEGDSKPTFTVVSPGVVKVSLPTAGMAGSLGGKDTTDAQQQAMMQKMFDGHFVTLVISGKSIGDTNMTLSDDKTSAQI